MTFDTAPVIPMHGAPAIWQQAMRSPLAFLLLCCGAGLRTASAQSVIHVPANHATIQAAINAAANGDTVLVAPGVYVENIDFMGKGITVASSGGANVTVIDGNAAAAVVTFSSGESSATVLRGFTIRNGRAGVNSRGSGIRILGASPVITENVIIDNNGWDGAIAVLTGAPLIERNVIAANKFFAGVYIEGTGSTQLLSNVIFGNGDSGIRVNSSRALSSVRLKVEQKQLVIGYERVGLGAAGLQGA